MNNLYTRICTEIIHKSLLVTTCFNRKSSSGYKLIIKNKKAYLVGFALS